MTGRKLRRLYMVEAQWENGIRRSRCYQGPEAAAHREQVWRTGTIGGQSVDEPAEWVKVTPSLPVVWEDES